MPFKRKGVEPKVHDEDIKAFAGYPVILAVLIEAGYITHWPHCWTRDGLRSRRRHEVPDSRKYNGLGVFQDANSRIFNGCGGGALRKATLSNDPAVKNHLKLSTMKGDALEAEAIDP